MAFKPSSRQVAASLIDDIQHGKYKRSFAEGPPRDPQSVAGTRRQCRAPSAHRRSFTLSMSSMGPGRERRGIWNPPPRLRAEYVHPSPKLQTCSANSRVSSPRYRVDRPYKISQKPDCRLGSSGIPGSRVGGMRQGDGETCVETAQSWGAVVGLYAWTLTQARSRSKRPGPRV
ncbi:unnamed protein product [Calypogeia fissa]